MKVENSKEGNMKATIQFTDNDGFITSAVGESEDPKQLKAKLVSFINTLLGEDIYIIRISCINTRYNRVSENGNSTGYKIPAIKAIRTVTGCSLKDAKDIADKLDGEGSAVSTFLSGSYTKEQAGAAKSILSPLFQVEVIEV